MGWSTKRPIMRRRIVILIGRIWGSVYQFKTGEDRDKLVFDMDNSEPLEKFPAINKENALNSKKN